MRALLLVATMALACANDTITRAEWQRMTAADRTLYVRTLLAEEKARDAKGGRGKTYDRPAEEYVARIDAAYARGESADVRDIFAGLSTTSR